MQEHDWIFDVIMDLCDKAEHIGLPSMSAKLEEALDAYLEDQGRVPKTVGAAAVPFASIAPISLGQDSFVFGTRRVAPTPEGSRVSFASRRRLPSVTLQQLRAARAQHEPANDAKDQPIVLFDRVG